MTLVLVAYLISLVFGILMVVRVWRASTLDGVLTLLLPFYFIVALIKYWNDPDHNIRFHVLGIFICSVVAIWSASSMTRHAGGMSGVGDKADLQARSQVIKIMREQGLTITPEQEQRLLSEDEAVSDAAWRELGVRDEGDGSGAVAAGAHGSGEPSRARDAEFDNPRPVAAQERPVETLSYAEAARRAVFNRGRWTRDSTGFSIDVPAKFRLISAADARRLDSARARPEDSRIMAWILHENTPLADPDSWHVKVRWISDGWVATQALEPVQLLQTALDNKQPQPRVAASSGDLLGYAVAPRFDGQVLEWAEERVLVNSDHQVVDCHALRPGRRGVLEFSIVGMAPGQLALCQATVRLLADRTSFLEGKEYPAAPPDGLRAPYTLAALATHMP
ncbi:DUF2167 domain-containing protein [Tahibacter harae]|uniref:DUF2167 domain-containing protein n=1 Tax=Tahibacter harae TaxID=2963937 RepID=A0ABT1QUI7_9GAMM|nr:DUF2167 domain-containing protein [Tahibacter harae]MCQ4165949.1 DUF2167 domain-containing protein [Tahibacter harae]